MTIASVDPRHGRAVEDVARPTTAQELDAVCARAAAAAAALGEMGRGARAQCFGPVLVAVEYGSADDLSRVISRLRGALTGTVHATAADHDVANLVVDQLAVAVGRVVWNGYPTGVAVAWAMHHGGPHPATTDPLHTSVGAAAIRRWLRPISYQNVPDESLPVELRDGDAPVPRRIDGGLVLPVSPPGTPAAAT